MKTDLSRQRVNYDPIAHLYDEPLRDHGVDEHLVQFLAARPWLLPAQLRILDMGCGTGKQLAANHPLFPGAALVGLDLFRGMLHQAQKRGQGVNWVQADNMAAPFASQSFHYITNQFSYAHVQNKPQFIAETYRLLKPGGQFVLTNIDPWSMPNWAIYRYFPAAYTLDQQDFLPVETLTQLLHHEGYAHVTVNHQHVVRPEPLADFLRYASMRYRTSEFMAISDADYADGLAAIKRDLEQSGDKLPIVDSEFCVITMTGMKEDER